MTDIRAETCGKPVGLAGHPCMRVPGHPGICLSGLTLGEYETAPVPRLEFPDVWGKRRIPWKLVAVAAVFWCLACFQLFVDVYLLAR
jgi:hypothetical protein